RHGCPVVWHLVHRGIAGDLAQFLRRLRYRGPVEVPFAVRQQHARRIAGHRHCDARHGILSITQEASALLEAARGMAPDVRSIRCTPMITLYPCSGKRLIRPAIAGNGQVRLLITGMALSVVSARTTALIASRGS